MPLWLVALATSIAIACAAVLLRRCDVQHKVKTAIIIGSGGHAGEMLRLTAQLDPSLYDVLYIAADSDTTSQAKFDACPDALRGKWHRIPRAREVHQSWFSTLFSTLKALLASARLVAKLAPRLVIANGPGTCVPICLIARLTGARLIFCESWCRVRDLSLTGKLLYPFAHRFVVHWACLCNRYPRAEFIGHLSSL